MIRDPIRRQVTSFLAHRLTRRPVIFYWPYTPTGHFLSGPSSFSDTRLEGAFRAAAAAAARPARCVLVISLACEGVAAWHTAINIYRWQPDRPAPSRIQMLGRNWEVVFDQVPTRPVSRRISRRPKKIFGLAAVDFAKLPAAGRKKIPLSRRFNRQLSRAAVTYKSRLYSTFRRKIRLEWLYAVLHVIVHPRAYYGN